jgi:hypothetical protein
LQNIFSNYVTAGDHTVKADVSNIQNGVYFLRLSNGAESQQARIVVCR